MASESRSTEKNISSSGALYQNATPSEVEIRGIKRKRHPSSNKKLYIWMIGILIPVLSVTVIYFYDAYQQSKIANLIPASVKSKSDFPLYYPTSLPEGYKAEPITSSGSPTVVTLIIKSAKAETIYLTQQKKPQDFDFDFFYNKTLQISREINLDIGIIRIGSAKGRADQLTASMVIEPTWILAAYPADIPRQDIDTILKSFKKIK